MNVQLCVSNDWLYNIYTFIYCGLYNVKCKHIPKEKKTAYTTRKFVATSYFTFIHLQSHKKVLNKITWNQKEKEEEEDEKTKYY